MQISNDNVQMLQRLQDQKSNYNVYEWESERRETVNKIKSICYHKPSLLHGGKKRTRRSTY